MGRIDDICFHIGLDEMAKMKDFEEFDKKYHSYIKTLVLPYEVSFELDSLHGGIFSCKSVISF